MKDKQTTEHLSIEKISTRASLWAVAATLLVVSVFSALAFIQERHSLYQSEVKRLGMTINGIARALAAEELTGDSKSIAALSAALQNRFELSRIEIVASIPLPPTTGWLRGILPPSEARWAKLPGVSPPQYVVITASSDPVESLSGIIGSILVCIPLVLFGVITTLKIQRDLRRGIVVPIQKLAKDPEGWNAEGPWVAQEAITLHRRLLNYIRERDAERDLSEQLKIQASIGQIASQVAHDIRSPLAALDMVSNHLSQLPEEKRIIVRSALSRIRDIANGLLEKQRQTQQRKISETRERQTVGGQSVELLSSLIDSLVTEKRMQYRMEWGLEIESPLSLRSYGLFAEVDPTDFKRVLSTLLNSVVEAADLKGRISVELEARGERIAISIRHTNPASTPQFIGSAPASVTPIRPQSMNYQEAKARVMAWNGRLELRTEPGVNTLEIEMPKAHVPAWFVPELILTPGITIAILDDDTSIHQIWQGRFDSLRLKERNIETAHLSMVEPFLKWHSEQTEVGNKILYLIDYELIGSQRNGLDLIQALNIQNRAILVTSRFEERSIRQACEKERIRLIPKSLAGFVPVRVHQPSEEVDAILIDDDQLVRDLWHEAAVSHGKRVRTFSTPNDFLRTATSFGIEVPLYVDFNLGEDVANGEQIAHMASEIGFREVWLTTGEDPQSRTPVPWIKGIRGKEPPWKWA